MNTSAGRCQDSIAIYFQSSDANYTLEFYKEKNSSKIHSDSSMKSVRSVTAQLPDTCGSPRKQNFCDQHWLQSVFKFSSRIQHCNCLKARYVPEPKYFACVQHFSTFFLLNWTLNRKSSNHSTSLLTPKIINRNH